MRGSPPPPPPPSTGDYLNRDVGRTAKEFQFKLDSNRRASISEDNKKQAELFQRRMHRQRLQLSAPPERGMDEVKEEGEPSGVQSVNKKTTTTTTNADDDAVLDTCAVCLGVLPDAPLQKLPCSHACHVECAEELRAVGFKHTCSLCLMQQSGSVAVEWLRNAADRGNAHAQCNLGLMYSRGKGVTRNHSTALRWFIRAAIQGHPVAQCHLGLMYEGGQGVAKDESTAFLWFRHAAAQGHAGAQNNLGCMYRDGRGVRRDDAAAAEWYRSAAEQGFTKAHLNQFVMYSKGTAELPSPPSPGRKRRSRIPSCDGGEGGCGWEGGDNEEQEEDDEEEDDEEVNFFSVRSSRF